MVFGRNLRLMQLMKVAAPAREVVDIDPGYFDPEKFGEVCEDLAFASITRNLESFTNTFKGQ